MRITLFTAAGSTSLSVEEGDADGRYVVDCEVNGYNLIIRNSRTTSIPEETAIEWEVRFARSEEVHVLDRHLEPGTACAAMTATDPAE